MDDILKQIDEISIYSAMKGHALYIVGLTLHTGWIANCYGFSTVFHSTVVLYIKWTMITITI